MRALLLTLALATTANAQWDIQTSGTTADLRGLASVGKDIAWASGTNGTVLRTEDGGHLWQHCPTPPDAEKLDFRGIQAFDANNAIVMSSGKGDLSRLYKTTDGCQTWKLVFTNPDAPDGFFDAILFLDPRHGILFGDPSQKNLDIQYAGDFRILVTSDSGKLWAPISAPDQAGPGKGLHPSAGESAFAASNSSIATFADHFWFATSASRIASRKIYGAVPPSEFLFKSTFCHGQMDINGNCGQPWTDFDNALAPIIHSSPSAGVFSLSFRSIENGNAVGGDYTQPNNSSGTSAFTTDGGLHWTSSQSLPRGYRSAVTYEPATKTWITVGPNGTDISTDDGRNWRALEPSPGQAADADQHWNALSLPFAVGPHGRIGILNPAALKP